MKKGSGGSATPGPFYLVLDAVRKQGEQAMGSHEEQVALLGLCTSFYLQVPAQSEPRPQQWSVNWDL